jgi:hypothetical protein
LRVGAAVAWSGVLVGGLALAAATVGTGPEPSGQVGQVPFDFTVDYQSRLFAKPAVEETRRQFEQHHVKKVEGLTLIGYADTSDVGESYARQLSNDLKDKFPDLGHVQLEIFGARPDKNNGAGTVRVNVRAVSSPGFNSESPSLGFLFKHWGWWWCMYLPVVAVFAMLVADTAAPPNRGVPRESDR